MAARSSSLTRLQIDAPWGGVDLAWQNPGPMRSQAKRTLVKSPPELWELADDVPRMEVWIAELMGSSDPVAVNVTDREPERVLAWRTADGDARIALELAEKGFGTAVSVTAEHARTESADAEAALEQLLDELGSPERRPFARH